MRRFFALLLVTPLLANCSDPATPAAPSGTVRASAAVPQPGGLSSAVMVLGNPQAGTDYTPPGSHDQSLHGRDRMIPGTVVIEAGGTVTFQVNPGHRVAIYNDGTQPEDLVVGTGAQVLDPTNRVFLQGAPGAFTRTFSTPGRYLVICTVRRHFVEAKMYGWVIVK